MQVILKKDIPQIGRIGEVVKVRDGYARNFLIPRSLAVAAHPSNIGALEHQKRLVEVHKKAVQKQSEELSAQHKGITIAFQRRFNESGKMFGTLTGAEVAQELAGRGLQVDRRDVEVDAVKAAGDYEARVRLPGDVILTVKIKLEAIEDKSAKKAKAPAKGRKPKAATEETEGEVSTAEASEVVAAADDE